MALWRQVYHRAHNCFNRIMRGAVAAIVQGAIMANRILRERTMWAKVRIDEVEFNEQREDIGIAYAIPRCCTENLATAYVQ